MAKIIIVLIQIYRITISPFIPQSCRFHPSCSAYAIEAFRSRGIMWGVWLTCIRLLKCNPFHAGGFDPVPGDYDHAYHERPAA